MTVGLIVGLGNPGNRYRHTRHNVGFWFIERLAARRRAEFGAQPRFAGEVARIEHDGARVWLLKPSTFMNLSGRSVAAVAHFYRIAPAEILVAHDDLDLKPGTVRLKIAGGHGGHNGLRDIVAQLGSADFARLRIGIGHPGPEHDVTPYVLSAPAAEDREDIDRSITRAIGQVDAIVSGEFDRVMNALNRRPAGPRIAANGDGEP